MSEAEIQAWLDKRRPGQSRFTTQRREPDAVRILSGVLPQDDGTLLTTGTPIALEIENVDQRSKDYGDIRDRYRPGHADFTYDAKYGIRDYRGGGRSSARETAARVAAGAIARKVVPGRAIRGALVADRPACDRPRALELERGRQQSLLLPRSCHRRPSGRIISTASARPAPRSAPSSRCVAEGVPPGLGAPIYAKLDQDICGLLMSINAVKGVEIGEGSPPPRLTGEENADEMRIGNDGEPLFLSNHAGGILGGISTGQPVVARFAVKPTSSILTHAPLHHVRRRGGRRDDQGRHDPCVGIRAVPIGEAMVACAIADHFLRHRGQNG